MIKDCEVKKDLYMAVNGEWLKTAVIPDDKPSVGGFQDLVIKTEEVLIKDFDNIIDVENEEMKKFVKYYNMTKDFETRDKIGVEPLKKYVDKIEAINTFEDFEKLANEWILKEFPLPYKFSVYSDMMEATNNVLYMDVAGTILPEKTYFGTEKGNELIEKYKEMLDKLLSIYGYDNVRKEKIITQTVEFDALFYPHLKTSVELADYTKLYNPRTLEEVEAYSKNISFKRIIENIIKARPEKIIVEQPVFFEAFNSYFTLDNLELIKSWLISKLILSTSRLLTNEIREVGGMYRRHLSGIDKEMSIEKYAYYHATSMFEEVVSVYYGEKYFGEKAKKDVEEMVRSMVKVYEKRLNENTWLKEKTRKSAIKKLETLAILVGYPEKYNEIYKSLNIEGESFFDNTVKFNEILTKYHYSKWNTEVDKLEWGMSSSTVNAYYNPSANHICFPAAILQAPFYNINQSKSTNYGGIGAVIGHEISHAFDNNGSKMDENGNLNNWWEEEDYKAFDNKAKEMIAQFDGIEFGDGKINGELTVSENIADAGGLSCALEALKNTGEYNLKEFFVNWAKVWCRKARPEYVNLLLKTDVHAPGELRANMQPRNLQDFYDAFDVKEEDAMFLPKEKRVSIW